MPRPGFFYDFRITEDFEIFLGSIALVVCLIDGFNARTTVAFEIKVQKLN